MKTLLTTLLALLPLLVGDGLNKKERKYATNYLEESKMEIFSAISALSTEQWNFQADEDSWSIAGICEHLLIAEQNTYNLVTAKIITDENNRKIEDNQRVANEEVISKILDRRPETKVKTPPPFEPKGVISSPQEFVQAYTAARAKNQKYLKETNDELTSYYYDGPAGRTSGYQWFIILAAHAQRHLMQIQEVMQNQDFPE